MHERGYLCKNGRNNTFYEIEKNDQRSVSIGRSQPSEPPAFIGHISLRLSIQPCLIKAVLCYCHANSTDRRFQLQKITARFDIGFSLKLW